MMGGRGSYKWRKLAGITQKQATNVKETLGGADKIDGFVELSAADQAAVLAAFKVAEETPVEAKVSKKKAAATPDDEGASPPLKKVKKSATKDICSTYNIKIVAVPATITTDITSAAHKLIDLAKNGTWVEVYRMLDVQPDLVNVRPEVREYAALHQAAYHGHVSAVETLLKKYGADPSQQTKSGQSAEAVAEEQGQSKAAETLHMYTSQLAEESGKVVSLTPEKVEKETPHTTAVPVPKLTADIVKAAHCVIDHAKSGRWQDLFEMLDKRKELVNVRPDVREYSALHQAAYHDNAKVLSTLIHKYGADPSLPTGSGLTLLEVAERQGCKSVSETLRKIGVAASAKAVDKDDEEMEAMDDDIDMVQMPDGSWKVMQKGSTESLDTAAALAAPSADLPTSSSTEGGVAPAATPGACPKSRHAAKAAMDTTMKKGTPADFFFPGDDKYNVYEHDGVRWHAMLRRGNQFHLMQIIEISQESYCVWNRWGKADTDGEHEAAYFASPELAAATFKAKFHEKTNNDWKNRTSFKQFFAKWTYKPESGVNDDDVITPPSTNAVVPAPPLTPAIEKEAHRCIDLARAGRWNDLFKIFLAQKMLVNVRPDVRDFSVLHQAAFQGNADVVMRLIDGFGADPASCTKFGLTAAEVADKQGFSKLAETIRKRLAKPIAVAGA